MRVQHANHWTTEAYVRLTTVEVYVVPTCLITVQSLFTSIEMKTSVIVHLNRTLTLLFWLVYDKLICDI